MAIKIGWSSTSITPDRPVNLFGMFNERISTHVEGPCMATVLALEGGDGVAAIWISCDLVSIQLDVTNDLRAAVAARIPAFPAENLLVSCTHTHSAPNFRLSNYPQPPEGTMLPEEYRVFFLERVTEAAVEAWQARKPGGVATALGHAVLAWCRRAVYADGTGLMYGKTERDDFVGIEGPMDPGVELLFTFDEADKPTGVMINTTCTAQTCMSSLFITADFWHPAREMLQSHFGTDFRVLATVSAAGDQCPDDLLRWNRSEPRLIMQKGARELARRLFNAVLDAYEHTIQPICKDPVVRHSHKVIDLPAYVMNGQEVAYYENLIADLVKDGEPDPTSWAGGTLKRARNHLERHAGMGDNPRLSIDSNFLRIGDMAVATNPFELYLEYGQRIKGRSPARQTVVAQLTNDGQSYLPTASGKAHGHYSAMPSNIKSGPEGGDKFVEESVSQLKALWEEV